MLRRRFLLEIDNDIVDADGFRIKASTDAAAKEADRINVWRIIIMVAARLLQ